MLTAQSPNGILPPFPPSSIYITLAHEYFAGLVVVLARIGKIIVQFHLLHCSEQSAQNLSSDFFCC